MRGSVGAAAEVSLFPDVPAQPPSESANIGGRTRAATALNRVAQLMFLMSFHQSVANRATTGHRRLAHDLLRSGRSPPPLDMRRKCSLHARSRRLRRNA